MLADDHLNMKFPDAQIHDFTSFQRWYERVINLFFDEKHTIQKVDLHSNTRDQADLTMTVRWQANWWEPPAAQSKCVDLESTQSWTVRRCPTEKNNFGIEIVTYIARVEDFKYAPGSAILERADETKVLVQLNQRMVDLEQQGGEKAVGLFRTHLSDDLIFRRATGKVVGKFGEGGFIPGLQMNPFKARVAEGITVKMLDDRALVSLVVAGTRQDDGSVHRYRNIRLFKRRCGTWILEFWYNYEIPGD
jgi:hypothetical protein